MANSIRRYEGRHAVITGGASGIGFKTAERIVSEGGTVSIWDVDAEKIDEAEAYTWRSSSRSEARRLRIPTRWRRRRRK